MFNQRLFELNQKKGYLCLGLDPVQELMPTKFEGIKGIEKFCKEIINACAPFIVAVKANLAFFEQFGSDSFNILERVRSILPNDILWILDGKRGDIGNTSERYAKALFDILYADAITVNPYMGSDSVEPFLLNSEKGVFLLSLTSNQGANDFQYHGDPPLWKTVIMKSKQWDKENLGFVIGATKEDQIAEARKLVGHNPFLIPGIGAQGGSLEVAVRDGLGNGKFAGLINVSRGLMYASLNSDYAIASAHAAENYSKSIQSLMSKKNEEK